MRTCSERTADFIGKGISSVAHRRLFIWFACVALIFYLFWELSDTQQQAIDPWLVMVIGLVKQTIVIMMLLFTRRWTWRAIGAMSVMEGVAILYLGSAFFYWHHQYLPEYGEMVTDLGRSFLLAGLTPLMIGVIRYAWHRFSTGDRSHDNDMEL